MMMAAIIAAFGIMVAAGGIANAQLFPAGSTTTPSSSVINATTTTSSTVAASSSTSTAMTATATSTVAAPLPAVNPLSAEYMQMSGLAVASIGTTASGTSVTQVMATVPPSGAACEQFITDSSPIGTSVACPVATPMMTPTSTTSSPAYYNPYAVVVDAATQVEANDRTPMAVANIMPGDAINVYGYYDGTGTMDAEIVRDLSRSSAGGTVTTGAGITAGTSTTAELQAELNQLETLAIQLEAELGMATTTVSSTATLPAACPMIPAGATSTAGCPPASSTSTATGTIYE